MGKINSFVYKDNKQLYLVPLVSESKIGINNKIFDYCDNKGPLKNTSIALSWFEENSPKQYNITPVVIVDLFYQESIIAATQLGFDDLVSCAYSACIFYTKPKHIETEIVDLDQPEVLD